MGYFFGALSALLTTTRDLFSKKISSTIDGPTSAFASFLYALPYYAVVLVVCYLLGWETFAFSSSFIIYVLLRGFFDTLAEWSKMSSFQYGDISLVSGFLSLAPVFVLITSPIITGDIPTVFGVVGVLLTVIGGAILIYEPGVLSNKLERKGIGFALLASFFFSLLYCFDRLAVKEASPLLSGFSMTLIAAALLLPVVLLRGTFGSAFGKNERKFLWGRGFFEILFMVCKLYALMYLQAPYVAGLLKGSVLFSILGGKFFFDEKNIGRRLCAGGVIFIGIVVIIIGG